MTLDQKIQALTAIATFFAALGALFAAWETGRTVKQIRRQTDASYRPQLTFARMATMCSSKNENWPIPSHWVEIGTSKIQELDSDAEEVASFRRLQSLGLKLYNVGSGAALNTTVVWEFPFAVVVDSINKLAQESSIPAHFVWRPGLFMFESDSWPIFSISTDDDKEHIDHVLPQSIEQSPVQIKIPVQIQILLSAHLYCVYYKIFKRTDNSGKIDDIIPLRFKILYEDISQNKHLQSFELKLKPVSVRMYNENDGLEAHINFEIARVPPPLPSDVPILNSIA